MSAPAFWDLTTNTSSTGYMGGFTASSSTNPILPCPPPHRPKQVLTCAQADRAADEQIAMYEAEAQEPCPHCGQRRDQP